MSHQISEFPEFFQDNFRRGKNTGALIEFKPKINGVTCVEGYKACLGCNVMYQKLKLISNHTNECKNKEKHINCCKKILGEYIEEKIDLDQVQSLVRQLKESQDIIKELQKELANKSEASTPSPKVSIQKVDEQQIELSDDLEDALTALLDSFQNDDFEYFRTRMLKIKEDQPKAFARVCKNLDISQDKLNE